MRPVERLDAYRLVKSVAVRVCILCDQPPLESRWSIKHQLIRAAMSAPANIAVGYALGTKAQLESGILDDMDPDLAAEMPRVASMLVGLLKRYGARPLP